MFRSLMRAQVLMTALLVVVSSAASAASKTAECPECESSPTIETARPDGMIVVCPDCVPDIEIPDAATLQDTPDEDWGEGADQSQDQTPAAASAAAPRKGAAMTSKGQPECEATRKYREEHPGWDPKKGPNIDCDSATSSTQQNRPE